MEIQTVIINDTTTNSLCARLGAIILLELAVIITSFGAAIAALTTCGIYAPVNFTVNSRELTANVL